MTFNAWSVPYVKCDAEVHEVIVPSEVDHPSRQGLFTRRYICKPASDEQYPFAQETISFSNRAANSSLIVR